jgi:hypothetical protein
MRARVSPAVVKVGQQVYLAALGGMQVGHCSPCDDSLICAFSCSARKAQQQARADML